MRRYELWQCGTEETGIDYSFFSEDNESARKLLDRNAILIWETYANSWEEACALMNEFLGWEPYKPMS